jgi:hypothetical protein
MIVELVTFKAPPGADWDDILKDARAVIPRWRANPHLLRKHFLLSGRRDGARIGQRKQPSAQTRMARGCREAHGRAAHDPVLSAADAARQRGRDGHRVVENRRKGMRLRDAG